MLTLILADSELELIPKEILNHPSVLNFAKKKGKSASQTLLDSSIHHSALNNFSDGGRRGRPDIVHNFLLLALDSILNLEGKLKVIVHTRNNQRIDVKEDTRIPKNYNRFIGLIEDLFQKGTVPEDKPLLILKNKCSMQNIIKELKADHIIVLSPKGEKANLKEYFKKFESKDIVCIIGGFPDGDFISHVYELADETISIYEKPLKVWTVTSEILTNYRNAII